MIALSLFGIVAVSAEEASAEETVTMLYKEDFKYGTYIIDKPGTYKLAENIAFNPNSPATLSKAIKNGTIPSATAAALGLERPVDAYHAGMPLATQYQYGSGPKFTPGGPLDARYDPAAYGVGFFAAIAVEAKGVTIDLNGKTLKQHKEHALLQRFFSLIELADQPFVPGQGPSNFGNGLKAAKDVVIKNGKLGRSSHHGIHGNGNKNVTVTDVVFKDYEVGALALNGVRGLTVTNATAVNRKDVPVLGTFSSAMFIKAYVDDLVRTGSTTTLTVKGNVKTATDIQSDLQESINNTHADVMATGQINKSSHPAEYSLYNNPHRVIDGNSYSFLVNSFGVAVDGFPTKPDGVNQFSSKNVTFTNVKVKDQKAFINEIPALNDGTGKAMIDPVGAVFQVRNVDLTSGAPVTVSSPNDNNAVYNGNVVANAQAFVAKAKHNGDTGSGHLDTSRLSISQKAVKWVEGKAGATTLADIGASYVCNGDSMFHVNKGVIGFKIDAAMNVKLNNTVVNGLSNTGKAGSTVCGDYKNGYSHPAATLAGYGGTAVRAYTFAGSQNVKINKARVNNLNSDYGQAVGFAVLTDSTGIKFDDADTRNVTAGGGSAMPVAGPNREAFASGYYMGGNSSGTKITKGCAKFLEGYDGMHFVIDHAPGTKITKTCNYVQKNFGPEPESTPTKTESTNIRPVDPQAVADAQ